MHVSEKNRFLQSLHTAESTRAPLAAAEPRATLVAAFKTEV